MILNLIKKTICSIRKKNHRGFEYPISRQYQPYPNKLYNLYIHWHYSFGKRHKHLEAQYKPHNYWHQQLGKKCIQYQYMLNIHYLKLHRVNYNLCNYFCLSHMYNNLYHYKYYKIHLIIHNLVSSLCKLLHRLHYKINNELLLLGKPNIHLGKYLDLLGIGS